MTPDRVLVATFTLSVLAGAVAAAAILRHFTHH